MSLTASAPVVLLLGEEGCLLIPYTSESLDYATTRDYYTVH